jgi:hydroxymethylglutaryl-CoA synthase
VDAVDHLVVAGLHARAVRSLVRRTGVATAKVADDLTARLGNTASAHLGLMLAHVLDEAGPDETVLAVHLADGADAVVLRTTAELAAHRERRVATVAAQVAAGRTGLPYDRFLAWRGLLEPEPPRRPDPEAPAAPVTFRREPWKFGFTGSRCAVCGTRHLPPSRVCLECRSVDRMAEERLADARGTVATFTVDHLAHCLSPPVVAAVVDFDGGGRLLCEMTDVAPDDVAVGTRVAMTFRRLYTAPNGVHNYFWKARPVGARPEEAG